MSQFNYNPYMVPGQGYQDQFNLMNGFNSPDYNGLFSYPLQYPNMPNMQIPGMGQMGNFGMSMGAMVGSQMLYGRSAMLNPFDGSGMGMGFNMQARQQQMMMLGAMGQVDGPTRGPLGEAFYGMNMAAAGPNADLAAVRAHSEAQARSMHGMLNSPMGMVGMQMASMATGIDFMGLLRPGVAMLPGMMRAGMGMYRGDGQFGINQAELVDMTNKTLDYTMPGGKFDFSRSRGFSATQIGDMAGELQSANLLGSMRRLKKIDGTDKLDMSDDFTASAVKTGQVRDPNGGTPGFQQASVQLQSIQSSKIVEKVKEATGVLDLIREITGGDQSTPVGKLVQTLQSLTGGGLGQISMGQLERNLDQMRELAKMAGLTMEAMSTIVQQGAGALRARGLSSTMAPGIAMEATLASAVGSAYLSESNYGGEQIGRPTRESILRQSMGQQTGFASSNMALRMGSFMNAIGGAEGLTAALNKGGLSASDREVLEEMNAAAAGAGSASTYNLLGNAQGLQRMAATLSNVVGGDMSVSTATGILSDRRQGARGLAQNAGLLANATVFQTEEMLQKNVAAALGGNSAIRALGARVGRSGHDFLTEVARAGIAFNEDEAVENLATTFHVDAKSVRAAGIAAFAAFNTNAMSGVDAQNTHAILGGGRDAATTRGIIAAHAMVNASLRASGVGKGSMSQRIIAAMQNAGDTSFMESLKNIFNVTDAHSLDGPMTVIAGQAQKAHDELMEMSKPGSHVSSAVRRAKAAEVAEYTHNLTAWAEARGLDPATVAKEMTESDLSHIDMSAMSPAAQKETRERVAAANLKRVTFTDPMLGALRGELDYDKGVMGSTNFKAHITRDEAFLKLATDKKSKEYQAAATALQALGKDPTNAKLGEAWNSASASLATFELEKHIGSITDTTKMGKHAAEFLAIQKAMPDLNKAVDEAQKAYDAAPDAEKKKKLQALTDAKSQRASQLASAENSINKANGAGWDATDSDLLKGAVDFLKAILEGINKLNGDPTPGDTKSPSTAVPKADATGKGTPPATTGADGKQTTSTGEGGTKVVGLSGLAGKTITARRVKDSSPGNSGGEMWELRIGGASA